MPDQLPPQPPPDAPEPPASEAALKSRDTLCWMIVIGVISMIGLLATPLFTRTRMTGCGPTEEINNARQIGIALFEFEAEYGKFPDASTVAAVKDASGTYLSLEGDSSNAHFTQLIAAGICSSEPMFYAKAKGAKKPDGVFNSDATAIAHGECGFAYIAGLDATGNPSTPIIFGPVIPGTKTLDIKANNGKVVILKLDNSVTTLPINAAGKIIFAGMDMLDPRNPIWYGKAPDVKWPK